ncbi:MAG: tRNA (adenosine(37)-N6)-threonylcarbamoyltransferase complex ATPase subunit type 1 TsaE [Nitrospirae bacterium]|nr:tRNA (adenosine(37)-N6)-threonylcarbamoyltransferase complex ATPase subunit type 1 TsaE [Nitrospirota bacterium]
MFSVITSSPEQTWEIGRLLGKLLDAGDTVCLYGDLGAGKTNLAYGIARGLDVREQYITSPTFTFVNEYQGRVPLYHIDLYRLKGPDELENIGFDEYIESDGVTVIEWAERAEDELPEVSLGVYLTAVDEKSREFGFLAEGERYEKLVAELKQELDRIKPLTG